MALRGQVPGSEFKSDRPNRINGIEEVRGTAVGRGRRMTIRSKKWVTSSNQQEAMELRFGEESAFAMVDAMVDEQYELGRYL
jgi:hypothetical protein